MQAVFDRHKLVAAAKSVVHEDCLTIQIIRPNFQEIYAEKGEEGVKRKNLKGDKSKIAQRRQNIKMFKNINANVKGNECVEVIENTKIKGTLETSDIESNSKKKEKKQHKLMYVYR